MHNEDFIIRYGESENSRKNCIDLMVPLLIQKKLDCMCGTLLGMYATGNGTDINNWRL